MTDRVAGLLRMTRARVPLPIRMAVALSIVLAAFASPPLYGSPDDGPAMLMGEIAGNRYERDRVTPRGELTRASIIEVGALRQADGTAEVPLSVTTFSADGKIKGRVNSVWQCRRREEATHLPALKLADVAKPGSGLQIMVEGDPVSYPTPPQAERLSDLALKIHLEKGFFSLLGSRSVVAITHRRVIGLGSPKGDYTVTADVDVRVYMFGIRVRHSRYRSAEVLEPGVGLVRVTLEASDRSRSVIRLLR